MNYSDTPDPNTPARSVYPLWFVPVVDSYQPCRAFRISEDHLRIERSLDYGETWSTVVDGRLFPQNSRPTFRSVVVAAPGTVVATETSNGDGLVASSDGGTSWHLASGSALADTNLIGEYPYTVVAGPGRPGGGLGDLYVATLACQGSRTHSAQDCSTLTGAALDTGGPGSGSPGDLGPIRLYVSRDGGATWTRFGNDPLQGMYQDCSVASIYIVPDPYSPADADHLWIDYSPASLATFSQCGVGTLVEATGDGHGGYALSAKSATGLISTAPFVVTRGPGATGLRLVSGNFYAGYSDDDGTTWNGYPGIQMAGPLVYSAAADPSGDVFGVAFAKFPGHDGGSATDFRAVVRRPSNPHGLADMELGASPGPSPGQADRSLFNYPHYAPLIPTLHNELLVDTTDTFATTISHDGNGNFYIAVGDACYTTNCTADSPDPRLGRQPYQTKQVAAQWHLLRYTMPPSGQLPILANLPPLSDDQNGITPHTTASCKNQGRCALVPLHACTIAAAPYPGGPDRNGTLAFDGAELLYTRTYERSDDADPYSAVIRRLSPDKCADTGGITVHFPSDEYLRARQLTWADWEWYGPWISQPEIPASRPLIDSLTYDATHDRVYFTLRTEGIPNHENGTDDGSAGDENQLALWTADLHSVDGVPSSSITATLVSVTTGHCPSSNMHEGGAGSRTLAFDRMGDNLAQQSHPDGVIYACLPGRPAELDVSGRQIDEPCYGAYDMNGHSPSGLDIASWTMEDQSSRAARHRALLWLDEASNTGSTSAGFVAVYDLTTCREDRLYSFASSQHLAPTGSTALACDPVTYGSGLMHGTPSEVATLEANQAVPPFAGTLGGAVLWSRVGSSLQANLIPDNGDPTQLATDPTGTQTCRLPVSLAYVGPTVAIPGSTITLLARLSVDGPDAPVKGQQIEMAVNGVPVAEVTPTDGEGIATATYTVPAGGTLDVTLTYAPGAGNLAFYPAGPVGAAISVGAFLPPAGPTNLPPPLPNQAPQLAPRLEVPLLTVPFLGVVPAPAIAPAAQGGQGQTVSQGQAQPAAAKEKEEEQELALALADDDQADEAGEQAGAPPGDGSYSITALQHGDPSDPALAFSAGALGGMFALMVGLRRRAGHALARRPALQRRERRRQER